MPFNKQSFRKHASRDHVCSICGKKGKGNGFYNHRRACNEKQRKIAEDQAREERIRAFLSEER